jgi:alkyldihydroxyacetonephosphate synthase
VLRPGSHDEVAEVLTYCAEHRIAVVPFGGGTSVVTGVTAERGAHPGVVSLDLARMSRLLVVDEVSMTSTLEPGLRGPQAEALLAERGLTLGHFPQSFEYATIGGFAATRSSGQSSAGYGRFDAMVLGIRLATPTGTLEVGRAPASATGPDLRQLVLGSEGAFGVITAVTVRVRPLPAVRAYEGWSFESFGDGARVLRRLAQAQLLPTVLRLSDESESALSLAPSSDAEDAPPKRCLLVAGYEGGPEAVATRRAAVADLLTQGGGTALGAAPGEAWQAGRFAGPYLRDSMLDVGVLVETVETATFWSGLDDLYARVSQVLTDALGSDGSSVLVLCHISHVYETGCSLYFTVVAATGTDPVERWTKAKAAASDAILAAGGTISHHHGVGRDHKRWLAEELGPVGVRMLRAIKTELDPQGVMNPGVLVP